MSENETGQQATNPASGQGETQPESLLKEHDPETREENTDEVHEIFGDEKRSAAERIRRWTKRWRIVLGLVIPSIFSAAVLVVICLQSGIYQRQADLMSHQLTEMQKSTDAATSAAKSARESIDISRKSVEQTNESIELTKRNTELSQRNIELAQKNLEAVQQGLEYASKANEISQTGLETTNTPSLEIGITGVGLGSDYFILKTNNSIEVNYVIKNLSDAPAQKVSVQSFLDKHIGADPAAVSNQSFAVMPHQTVKFRETVFSGKQTIAELSVAQIMNSKIGIKVYVSFFSSLGKKKDFIETFYMDKERRAFGSRNTEFDPPEKEILELTSQSLKP